MTYATQQDLIDRFNQKEILELSDHDNSGSIDATVVGKALADADDEINAYVAVRYALPLSPVPKIITRLAADMARYFLYDDRATEQVRARYDAAIKFLRGLAAGQVTIGPDAAGDVAAQAGGAQADANDRVFTVGRPSKGTEGTLDDYLG